MLYIIAAVVVLILVFNMGEHPTSREERGLALLPDFTPGVRFQQTDQKLMLALDPNSERFLLIRDAKEMRVYGFDELVAVEVERDGQSLQRTNRGSQVMGAAIGAALLGPVGLLVGGVTGSRRIDESVKRMTLKLYTTDLNKPVQEVVFFDQRTGLSPDNGMVQKAARELDEWYGRFLTVLHGQRRSANPVVSQDTPAAPQAFGRRRPLIARD